MRSPPYPAPLAQAVGLHALRGVLPREGVRDLDVQVALVARVRAALDDALYRGGRALLRLRLYHLPARAHRERVPDLGGEDVLEVEDGLLPVRVLGEGARREADRLVAAAGREKGLGGAPAAPPRRRAPVRELAVEPGDERVRVVGALEGQAEGRRKRELLERHRLNVHVLRRSGGGGGGRRAERGAGGRTRMAQRSEMTASSWTVSTSGSSIARSRMTDMS